MKKNKPVETPLQEYVDLKMENKDKVERKQHQETKIRSKRQRLKDAVEDRDWQ